MTRISDLHRRWSKHAAYTAAYNAFSEAIDLARALIVAADSCGPVTVAAHSTYDHLAALHRLYRG